MDRKDYRRTVHFTPEETAAAGERPEDESTLELVELTGTHREVRLILKALRTLRAEIELRTLSDIRNIHLNSRLLGGSVTHDIDVLIRDIESPRAPMERQEPAE